MAERPRFFDDLAGVAGGAFSALAGMREEVEATIRARVEEAIRKLDLVKREDLEAVQEIAVLARQGQEAAERRLAALEAKVAGLQAAPASTGGPASGNPGSGTAAGSTPGTEAAPGSTTPAATDLGTPVEPPAID